MNSQQASVRIFDIVKSFHILVAPNFALRPLFPQNKTP